MGYNMNIQVGFSRARSNFKFGSRLIAESEKRNYSHAFILFEDPTSEIKLIFQASHGQVNVVNYEIFKESNVVVKLYDLPIDQPKFIEFYKFMDANLGKKYSLSQILWLALAKVLQIKKWPKSIYAYIKNGTNQEICSELSLRVIALLSDNYSLPEDLQIDQFTPSELDSLLETLKFPCEVLDG